MQKAAPGAVEYFAYGLPGFKYQGRPLGYFGAAKTHLALYGLSRHGFEKELAPYDTDKGTIRFQPEKPVPAELITKLIQVRMASIEAAEAERKTKKAAARKSA
jgi:uncharacterized protein YdhG (YjbR/CyaY superfamily)